MSSHVARRDRIEDLVGQWAAERPDLDLATMGLVARVLTVAAQLDRGISETATAHGLNRGEGDVLFTLRRAGAPFRLSPSRLAAATLVTSGTMTNRLDRLEQKGWVRRIPSAKDRRSLDVELSESARATLDAAGARHARRGGETLGGPSGPARRPPARPTREPAAPP